MQTFLFLAITLSPSLLWLFYYLRQDPHPEPRKKILRVFFLGMLATLPALMVEETVICLFSSPASLSSLFQCPIPSISLFRIHELLVSAVVLFGGIAFTEEFLKFFVVDRAIIKDKDFDEPIDAMIYMIVAGLGFATAENLLIFYSSFIQLSAQLPVEVFGATRISVELTKLAILRFVGATFLHALLGGLMGFFVALSLLHQHARAILLGIGLLVVTLLHGFFNLGIITVGGTAGIILWAITILGLASLIPLCFKKIRRLQAICEVK